MSKLKLLWRLIGGHRLDEEDHGPAQKTRIILLATLASVVLAALFGVALAGGDTSYALGNLYRMPLVVLLSGAAALPPALLAWRMTGTERPASDLSIGLAAGTFTGTLVLACMAPVVMLYGHTTEWVGPVLALTVAAIGTLVGLATTWRAVLVRGGKQWATLVLPLVVLGLVHVAALTQLISISSLMPEVTFLDQGIEGVARR